MRKTKFNKMKTIEKEKDMNDLQVGECFLYGKNIIAQKGVKEVGEPITYYQVINKTDNGVEYSPIYDYMEKDKGEEL